jgi:osmoprotectant transport system ATP-binding protein
MIEFDAVSKVYDGGVTAVDALTLNIPAESITVFVGPSGCGKTTSLRMINRLEQPTQGSIRIGGRDIATEDPITLRRGIGYVLQNAGLFPHQRIADNIATVPRLLGWTRQRIEERVHELADLVGLDPDSLSRYPHQLSGGQQQRVGVARALAADPPVLLMDEPFGAVDPLVRARLQDELLRLQGRLAKTIVFVTHDIDEALRLGDQVAVFQQGGVLAQCATPRTLLGAPANDFVDRFLGQDRALRLLGLIQLADVTPAQAAATDSGADTDTVITPLAPDRTLRDALDLMLRHKLDEVPCADDQGRPRGSITRAQIDAALS